jgi:ribosomal protein S18 acetylase RimI-like enzyme
MKIRQAKQGDAKTLGPLIFSSAPIAIAATFDIDDKLSALNFLQISLSCAAGQYGYDNHWVAEIDNIVVGCLSVWHSDLPDTFHQATLKKLTEFYGIANVLSVVQASQALQDCIPKPKKHEWCIGHFAVLAQYQRQGVATALVNFAHEQALNSGKSALCLDVESNNSQAIDFYIGQGFVQKHQSKISSRMQALGIGRHLHLSKTTNPF